MAKPAIRLFVTDEGYRAIGHVAAQWAYLETQLDHLASVLVGQEEAKKLGLRDVQSFKQRMSNMRSAAKAVLKDRQEVLREIESIIADASSLRGFRDDIVHGQWKLMRKGEDLFPGIISIKRFPKYKVKEVKFTYEKAEDIAAKISYITVRVMNWCQKNILYK